MTREKAILIDIDGTICDSSYPISYLNGERDKNNYETYYRTLDIVQPFTDIISDITSKCMDIDNKIIPTTLVFLTGRTADIHATMSTMEFIKMHFNKLMLCPDIKFDFQFRPINLHIPSKDYKIERFEALKNLYWFSDIYEDEPLNVEMFYTHKQNDCNIHWVQSDYNFALEEQPYSTNIPEDVIIHKVMRPM